MMATLPSALTTKMMTAKAFVLLISLLYVVQFSSAVASAQTATAGEDRSSVEEFGVDLYALSDAELEEICTIRGFELVQEVDDATGEQFAYTHDDYVEAAKQCLAIERDMEAIIEEHPEILDELEAERDRMMEEKERLEQKLEEAESARSKETGADAAFLPKQKTTSSGEASAPAKEPKSVVGDESESAPLPPATTVDEDRDEGAELEDSDSRPSPLSIQELVKSTALEFRDRVQRDLERVIEKVLPESIRGPLSETVRPIVKVLKQVTKDTVKFLVRHGRVLFKRAGKKVAEQMNEIQERRAAKQLEEKNAPTAS